MFFFGGGGTKQKQNINLLCCNVLVGILTGSVSQNKMIKKSTSGNMRTWMKKSNLDLNYKSVSYINEAWYQLQIFICNCFFSFCWEKYSMLYYFTITMEYHLSSENRLLILLFCITLFQKKILMWKQS